MKVRALSTALCVVMLALIAGPGTALAAKPVLQGQAAPVTVQPIKGGIYLVKGGSGANTAFVAGEKSVCVIDAKMTADSARAMIAEIGKITSKPITHVLITHSDGDHVNGLDGFPAGLTIVASENTAQEMAEAFKDERYAPLRAYLPNLKHSPGRKVTLDNGFPRIDLLHFGAAHTSGDTIVYFPVEKVAFVGDLAFVGRDPLIHRQKGGTSMGYAATLKKMLDLDVDTYLSGHADPLTKADLKPVLAALEDKMAKVQAMVKEGKSIEDVRKAFGIEAPAAGATRRPSLVEVIYLDLTEKK
jgi:cyclase